MTESAGAVAPSSLAYRVFLVAFGMVQITLGAGLIVGTYFTVCDGSKKLQRPCSYYSQYFIVLTVLLPATTVPYYRLGGNRWLRHGGARF